MGALPDGIVQCICCSKGVIEIKWPFSCRNKSFLEAVEEKGFCMELIGRGIGRNFRKGAISTACKACCKIFRGHAPLGAWSRHFPPF